MTALPLRPLQEKAMAALREALRQGKRRPIIQAPTGYGKTVLAAHIVAGAHAKGNRVAFVVPQLTLIDQTFERFVENGIEPSDMGVTQGNHPWRRPNAPIQICSVQTIASRGWPEVAFVVVDECHLRFKTVEEWMSADAKKIFIGLSATPWSKGLADFWDDLIIPTSIEELIEQGFLSPFKAFAPAHPDLQGIKIVAGDYHEGQLSERMSKPQIVGDVVQTWLDKAERRPTIVFAVDRSHANLLHEAFEAAGVESAYVDANTPREERAEMGKKLNDGRLEVVCSVGTMVHGVDLDVRCIVFARPTRSEILLCQAIGRGLRIAPGKQDCVARDTLILTDRGEVKIQDITLDHRLWDGVGFVSHQGAICRGVQRVIAYDGLTATPDHKVMTDVGWKTLQEAYRGGKRVIRTGFGGTPLRFTNDSVSTDREFYIQPTSRSRMFPMQSASHGTIPQYEEEAEHSGLSHLQLTLPGYGAEMAVSTLSGATGSLLQSIAFVFQAIWSAWNRISLFRAERSRALGGEQFGDSGSVNGLGSHQQRWPLRAWEFALGDKSRERQQYEKVEGTKTVRAVSADVSGDTLRRQNIDEIGTFGNVRRTNYRAMECTFVQTEGEVWDILNSGPLQRFTANGRLVHNCLILDHSDSLIRLGLPTDIHHEELLGGKNNRVQSIERKPPLPKDCPQCAYLVPAGVYECPNCGFKPKHASVRHEEGELVELELARKLKRRTNEELTWAEKERLFGELKGYARERDYKEGWAANKYRERTGVWPNDPRVKYAFSRECGPATRSWIRSSQIRWAKGRQRRDTDEIIRDSLQSVRLGDVT